MLNWFYNWIDPKILRLEKWVNKKVVTIDMIDIDLDKVKEGELRENNMFRQPPHDGKYGPFICNLQGGAITDFLVGLNEFEAFALISHSSGDWWRHRDGGSTEDFKVDAFASMQEFFEFVHGDDQKYWDCQLRTRALNDAEEK